ncbi:MAG: DeoR/GlpR family DNA-binding transcription regulator [Treponema sp.]|jgi:DeoR family deoxyribose operon repressor|nr:DeoR/GlpR family DNA-binding transcription regulator [Treponema sp.]
MKKKSQRLASLVSMLRVQGIMRVSDIARQLGVSEMTIRRDLNELQKNKFVDHLHGKAALQTSQLTGDYGAEEAFYNLSFESAKMNEEKKRIARHAASLIKPDDIIILDGGSTTEKILDYIPGEMALTVVCYTLNIVTKLPKNEKIKILLAGGHYHPGVQVFESPEGAQFLKNIRAHKLFLAISGVHPTLGMTCVNNFEIMVKKTIVESALTKILVTDSSKFGELKSNFFAPMDVLDMIITDTGISGEWTEIIKEKGIELITV